MALHGQQRCQSLAHFFGTRQHVGFEVFVQRDGRQVHASDHFRRHIEVPEAPSRNVARQRLRKAVGHRLLGQHQAPVRPGHARFDGVVVHGLDGAEVEEFDLAWEGGSCFLSPMHTPAVRHHGGGALGVKEGVVGGKDHAGLSEWDAVIAVGLDDGDVTVWSACDGNVLRAPRRRHKKTVNCLAFHPSGWQLASGSDDANVRVWDAEMLRPILTLRGHARDVRAVAFSHDGREIVSGSYSDNTVRFWKTRTE